MDKDSHLLFESYLDGITQTKKALGGHIMSIVKHGIPSKEEFIKIRQELHDNVKEIQARGTPATEEEKARGQEIIAKIKNYRSQHPDDPPPYEGEESDMPEQYAKDMEKDYTSQKLGSENAEDASGLTAIQKVLINELKKKGFTLTKVSHTESDEYPTVFMKKQTGPMHTMAEISGMGAINGEHYKDYLKNLSSENEEKSPFHYDPMHGLASAAHKIRDELQSAANDEARPEHIEKMAEIILGPQSEYASADHYKRALNGVIELLNHYVVVAMN